MSKFNSLLLNTNEDGTITIKLHEGDVMALLDLLEFAALAANTMSKIETDRGTTKGVLKMNMMSRDADALHGILFKHLDIGEPDVTKIH